MRLMFLTGSRGEWGYIRPVIEEAQKRGDVCDIVTTNMHVSHGTKSFIEQDGFPIRCVIPMLPHDTNATHAIALGKFLESMTVCMHQSTPDWLVLAGDRGEQLMGAIAGAYGYIPTAHIQAGERSGNIDNSARMAIAKLAHIHFASNLDAEVRLQKMGEEPWRIFNTGAPQIDDIKPGSVRPMDEEYVLVVFHPTTSEAKDAERQVVQMRRALDAFGKKQVWIGPNNDPGWQGVSAAMPPMVYNSLPRSEYLQLLEHAVCIVGNSSSGLLEAPSFGTPCVNIGNRQIDRHRGPNVIDVGYETEEIIGGLRQAEQMDHTPSNEYGDGRSAPRIVSILHEMHGSANLTNKRMVY